MNKLWLLILVKRGFIQEPEIYYDELSAKNRERELQKDINPDYDELEGLCKLMFATLVL